jgi:membrane protein required for colicin V production
VNWLDYVFLGILFFSVIQSFRRGFSREIIGVAAMFFAFIVAMWFYGLAGSLVSPYVSSARTANMIGFFMVVIGVLMVGAIVGWIVSRFIRTVGLSFFDRLLGAAFGFVRGVLISMALLTAWTAFGAQTNAGAASDAVLHSRFAPYVLSASRLFVAVAPMDLKQSFRHYYSQAKSIWQGNGRQTDQARAGTRNYNLNEGKLRPTNR